MGIQNNPILDLATFFKLSNLWGQWVNMRILSIILAVVFKKRQSVQYRNFRWLLQNIKARYIHIGLSHFGWLSLLFLGRCFAFRCLGKSLYGRKYVAYRVRQYIGGYIGAMAGKTRVFFRLEISFHRAVGQYAGTYGFARCSGGAMGAGITCSGRGAAVRGPYCAYKQVIGPDVAGKHASYRVVDG